MASKTSPPPSLTKQPARTLDSKVQQEIRFIAQDVIRQIRIALVLGHDVDEVDRQ